MAFPKKPTLVKSKPAAAKPATAAKFVAGAASQSKSTATFELVPYTFRIDQGLLDRVKAAATAQSSETGIKVTVTAFITAAIMEKVKKCEAEK